MSNNSRQIPIQVSARVLRHVSRGIYRTPAGALKELVSNSYDAGAKKVTINSGYPLFEKIIVTDNGYGMSEKQFINVIQNIGLSEKIAGTEFEIADSELKRTTIGHYGIGMLAIGQLCKRAVITSKEANSNNGFEAIIDFDQFDVKRENEIERSVIKDESDVEKEEITRAHQTGNKKFPIGSCRIKSLKYASKDTKTHFTKVELQQVRQLVQMKLSGGFYKNYKNLSIKKKYSASFTELLKLFQTNEEDIRRGQYPYEKLCWELSIYCPVAYPDIDIFDKKTGGLNFFKKIGAESDFSVTIDGMALHKPYEKSFFKDPKYPIRRIFTWEDEEYAPGKKVSGFIIHRQRIRPKSLQGILIREAGVAVGNYDLTFLEYPYHEGAKFEQLTGEIFVNGLSGALNIDRSSFNETDDHYLALIKWFHNKLHTKVFKDIQKELGAKRREDVSEHLAKSVLRYFRYLKKKKRIIIKNLPDENILFDRHGNLLVINKKHPLGKPRKKNSDRLLLASLLVLANNISPKEMQKILTDLSESER